MAAGAALRVMRTSRCLRVDYVETPVQPGLQEPASPRANCFGAVRQALARSGKISDRLLTIGSDRGQLASPANGRTSAFGHAGRRAPPASGARNATKAVARSRPARTSAKATNRNSATTGC